MKVKGKLAVTVSSTIKFVDAKTQKPEFQFPLSQVVSYDLHTKLLTVRNRSPFHLHLSKSNGKALQKCILDACPLLPAPVNFIENQIVASPVPPPLPPRPHSPMVGSSSVENYARALFDYIPTQEDELGIKAGERLILLDQSSKDWWLVKRIDGAGGREGVAPSSYLSKEPDAAKEINEKEEKTDKISRTSSPRPVFLDELISKTQKSVELLKLIEEKNTENKENSGQGKAKLSLEQDDFPPEDKSSQSTAAESCPKSSSIVEKDPKPSATVETGSKSFATTGTGSKSPAAAKIDSIPHTTVESSPEPPPRPFKKYDAPNSSSFTPKTDLLKEILEKRKAKTEETAKDQVASSLSSLQSPKKENPWSNVKVQKPSTSVAAKPKSLPKRPEQAVSCEKPKPADTRLWADRSGRFQLEAEFIRLSNEHSPGNPHAILNKLNGQKIIVAISSLCSRDREYIARKTGTSLNTKESFEWIKYFASIGIDSRRAVRYSQYFGQQNLDDSCLPALSREKLLSIGISHEADIHSILESASKQKAKLLERDMAKRNLESVQRNGPSIKDIPVLQPERPKYYQPIISRENQTSQGTINNGPAPSDLNSSRNYAALQDSMNHIDLGNASSFGNPQPNYFLNSRPNVGQTGCPSNYFVLNQSTLPLNVQNVSYMLPLANAMPVIAPNMMVRQQQPAAIPAYPQHFPIQTVNRIGSMPQIPLKKSNNPDSSRRLSSGSLPAGDKYSVFRQLE